MKCRNKFDIHIGFRWRVLVRDRELSLYVCIFVFECIWSCRSFSASQRLRRLSGFKLSKARKVSSSIYITHKKSVDIIDLVVLINCAHRHTRKRTQEMCSKHTLSLSLFLCVSLSFTHTHAHARTHRRTHVHTRTHTHTRARVHTHTHTHTHTHVHTHTHTHAHTRTQTHTHTKNSNIHICVSA